MGKDKNEGGETPVEISPEALAAARAQLEAEQAESKAALEALVAEKVKAGLTREQAIAVAEAQQANDARIVAAKSAKKGAAGK